MSSSRSTWFSVAGCMVILALVLGACGPQPVDTPTEAPPEADGEIECPIVIGAPIHRTGGTAIYDMPPWNAARLAVTEINEAGGILGCQIELLELDGRSDPAQAGDAATVAVGQGAEILIGPCDFDMGSPVSIVAQEEGLVGVSMCAGSPLYSRPVLGDKQFTVGLWVNNLAATIAEFAIKEMEMETAVTIVMSDLDFTRSMGRYFKEAWEHHGGEIVLELDYRLGDMDFAAQVDRILALPEPPDAMLLAVDMPDAGLIVRSVRAAGIEAAFLNASNLDTPDFYGAVGADAGNDIYISVAYLVDEESGPDMAHFIEAYEAEFGERPTASYQTYGYDLVYILKQAIEIAGTTDGASMAEVMRNNEFDVIDGTFSWSADVHEPSKPLLIIEVQGGESSFLSRFEASYVPAVD